MPSLGNVLRNGTPSTPGKVTGKRALESLDIPSVHDFDPCAIYVAEALSSWFTSYRYSRLRPNFLPHLGDFFERSEIM